MIINVLVCRTDGTQSTEEREVADAWFPTAENETEAGTADITAENAAES